MGVLGGEWVSYVEPLLSGCTCIQCQCREFSGRFGEPPAMKCAVEPDMEDSTEITAGKYIILYTIA